MTDNAKEHVDAKIVTLERRMEEQRGEIRRELDKLIKMNRALGRENKAL